MTKHELQRALEAKRTELKYAMDSAKDSSGNIPVEAYDQLKSIEAEVSDLNDKYTKSSALEAMQAENAEALKSINDVSRLPQAETKSNSIKSLGEQIVDSGALKMYNAPKVFDFKTVMSTGAGFAPFSPRQNFVVEYARRKLTLLDVLPFVECDSAAYVYMEQTTYTNNAAEKTESAQGALVAYGESAIAYTQRTVSLSDIGTFIPVTEMQLAFVPGLIDTINQELSYAVRQRLELQLLSGNGTAPNISGILDQPTIQTTANAGNPFSAIYDAITKVRAVGFAEPTHIIMHPNDWSSIRVATGGDGTFIYEDVKSDANPMLFGIPVIVTTAMTENTGLVVDLNYFRGVNHGGVRVELDRMSDDLKNGMKTIRANAYATLAALRPTAACTVTAL